MRRSILTLAAVVLVTAGCAAPGPTVVGSPAPTPSVAASPTATARPTPSPTPDVSAFYAGKTIRIIVGFNPGGAYDDYSRLVAKHLSRFVPGKPNVIVENRTGAASIVAANAVYGTEPQDGTAIANVNPFIVQQQALGAQGIQFDGRQFQWLGSARKDVQTCMVRANMPFNTLADLVGGKGPQVVIGTLGPGSNTHSTPAMFRGVLGANIKLVAGYNGTGELRLAYEGGEVDGLCGSVNYLDSEGAPLFAQNPPRTKVIGVLGPTTPEHRLLKGVPAAETLAGNAEDRLVLQVADGPNQIAIAWAVGPKVPAERAAALRSAFAAAFADPAFIADSDRLGRGREFSSGEEVTTVVQRILSAPKEVIDRLKKIFSE